MSVLLVIAALLAANAFFVTAEFALVGVPRAAIEHAAARGTAGARRVLALLDDPVSQDRFIATSQIGISLASIGLGMYGEHQMSLWLEARLAGWGAVGTHAVASALALAALTYLHIVIGEIVPKALALQAPERVITAIVPVMQAVEAALGPLVRALSGGGRLLLRFAGIARDAEQADRHHSPQELQLVIEESERGGLLEGESGEVLRHLFDFGDLTARSVMVRLAGVSSLDLGAPAAVIREAIRRAPHTRYLVRRDGRVIGSVHIKALMRILQAEGTLAGTAIRPIPVVSESATLDDALRALQAHGTQLTLVEDDHGVATGLLTMEDLCETVLGTIDESR